MLATHDNVLNQGAHTERDVQGHGCIAEFYRKRRASRSLSNNARMSSSRTGPLTFRIIVRVVSSMNSTRTWVTPPRDPVRPRTLITLASLTGAFDESMLMRRNLL